MSREPEKVLTALTRALAKMPHQRVGQLLDNARLMTGQDLFYISDKTLAEAIDAYLRICK